MSAPQLSLKQLATIDQLVNRFEDRWDAGNPPQIGLLLSELDSSEACVRESLLVDLIAVDLARRWQTAAAAEQRSKQLDQIRDGSDGSLTNRPLVEDYLRLYPELANNDGIPLRLIIDEYTVRTRAGQRPHHDEYRNRFPKQFAALEPLLDDIDNRLAVKRRPSPKQISGAKDAETTNPDETAAAPTNTASPRAVLRDFGNYVIESEIAAGGMGVVYRARHTKLNRSVALKMIKSGELASDEEVHRFLSEAEAAANLDHPNVVPIYEVGEQDGQHFFAMSFVEGQSLAEALRAGPLEHRTCAEVCRKVALAIEHAHSNGVVHRDLKPANILLDADGEPRVTDFGLAKQIERDSELTATGQILGTPSFMAPEQAAGRKDISSAADIYALGAILYNTLTGRPPFQAATVLDTLMQVREQEPNSPRLFDPTINRDLETICLKCLAKNPERRYESAQELASDLGRWLGDEPIQARPASHVDRLMKWIRRKPALASLSIVGPLAVLVLLVLIVGFFYQRSLEQAFDEAVQQRALAESAQSRAEASQVAEAQARKDLDRALYLRRVTLAVSALRDNQTQVAREQLEACPVEYRNWEWRYAWRQSHPELMTLSGHEHEVWAISFSPDGKSLVSTSRDRTLRIWDVATGKEVDSVLASDQGLQNVFAASFAPLGNRLVALASRQGKLVFWIWDRSHATNRILETGIAYSNNLYELTQPGLWFLDSARVVHAAHGEVRVRNLESNVEVASVPIAAIRQMALSRDRKWLAIGDQHGNATLWDMKPDSEPMRLTGHQRAVRVAFSPDNEYFVSSGADDGTLQLRRIPSGEAFKTIDVREPCLRVSFSPDGTKCATSHPYGTFRVWDTTTWKSKEKYGGFGSQSIYDLQFSPDGRYVASANSDGTIRLWDPIPDGKRTYSPPANGRILAIDVSPDGKIVVSLDNQGNVQFWHTPTGRLLRQIYQPSALRGLRFVDEGRQILAGGPHLYWYDWRSERVLHEATLPSAAAHIVVSRDRQIAGTLDWDGHIEFWNIADRTKLGDIDLAIEKSFRLGWDVSGSLSSDGRLMAARTPDERIRVWDVATQELLIDERHAGDWRSAEFVPNQKRLILHNPLSIRIWNLESRKVEKSLSSNWSKGPYAFTGDGSRMVIAAFSGMVRCFQLDTLDEILQLPADVGSCSAAAFSEEGTILVVGGYNGRINVWDGRPWTDQSPIEQRASALLKYYWNQNKQEADVRRLVADDPLTENAVRKEAIRLLDEIDSLALDKTTKERQ